MMRAKEQPSPTETPLKKLFCSNNHKERKHEKRAKVHLRSEKHCAYRKDHNQPITPSRLSECNALRHGPQISSPSLINSITASIVPIGESAVLIRSIK